MSLKKIDKELADILDNSTREIATTILRLASAKIADDLVGEHEAFDRFHAQVARSMILGDLLGRRRVLLEYDHEMGVRDESSVIEAAASTASPTVPNVPFSEAVENILSREPRLESDYVEIQRMYSEGDAFAAARSASQTMTERLQQKIAAMLKSGTTELKAKEVISEMGDFSMAYAGTVFRTNANTAYTRGRFVAARKPGVRKALPVFEVTGPTDVDSRPNHRALVGFMALTTDSVWANGYAPPYGYNCRHSIRLVGIGELRRRNLLDANGAFVGMKIPVGGYPDKGFEKKFLGNPS